uniref:Uncharacterized protein n=1 Tax=viral metagenome TaxID=1070528 RepID=A0A6M3LTY2_9ZZZZ
MTKTSYYAGVYQDYLAGRVLQVSDSIDCLSCEILAEPGVRSTMLDSVKTLIEWGQKLATRYNCQHIELNCSKGLGSYKWLKTTAGS